MTDTTTTTTDPFVWVCQCPDDPRRMSHKRDDGVWCLLSVQLFVESGRKIQR